MPPPKVCRLIKMIKLVQCHPLSICDILDIKDVEIALRSSEFALRFFFACRHHKTLCDAGIECIDDFICAFHVRPFL